MNSVPRVADRVHVFVFGLLCCGSMFGQEQALCDVLLRPAFNYSTDGLTLVIADSSTTYGILATATWDFGDGAGAGLTPLHTFEEPGTYDVCLTLTSEPIGCASTYCRQVTVPLDDCGAAVDAHFTWQPNGLNAAGIVDASILAFTGVRLWEFGDGSTSNEMAPANTWSLPGPHFVTLTHTQGECTATYGEWVEVDGNAGTCGPGLFVDFTSTVVDQMASFDPSVSATTTLPFASLWSYGDGEVDTTVFADHVYATPGSHQACLLVGALGLQEQDTCFSLVCHTLHLTPPAGINDHASQGVSVWPNPFASTVSISVPEVSGPIHTSLYDALGRVVYQERSNIVGTFRIDTEHIQEGPYVLEVTTGIVRHRIPVIKVRE